ncbi:MAG: hypothetical protein DRR42_18590 [Gammaproteobacteria bacterium]|nr:MAG: hypothetical protein DRR42_18590 [Gammaproteobacteria bacterium]
MNTSELISHLEISTFQIQTYCIDSNVVALIRRCIRSIYTALIDSEEDNATAGYLRLELLKLQSTPDVPSLEMLANCRLEDIERNKNVWGQDIANICNVLSGAIQALNENESPLLKQLVEVVSIEIEKFDLIKIKIWCHRKEREAFIDLFSAHNIELTDHHFICSLAEYRKTDFFEVLVCIGPLRSQGWSKTPKAILSAPRYSKLIQFIWEGSLDEKEFGLDPVIHTKDYLKSFSQHDETITSHIQLDDGAVDNAPEEIDDFTFLAERPIKLSHENSCVLIEFLGGKGVLLVPGARQLIFDQNAGSKPLNYKNAHEVESSNFLLLHDVEADLGSNASNKVNGVIAPLWKRALSNMYNQQYSLLMRSMTLAGINLLDLDRAAKKWMQSGGEVIYGPQSWRHFQLLIKSVLPDCLENYTRRQAWQEVVDSRVQAIQDGRIESTIVNEQLVKELYSKSGYIKENCSNGDFFRVSINPESGLSGTVSCYPVLDVSIGFMAPPEKLGVIKKSIDFEIYRVDI